MLTFGCALLAVLHSAAGDCSIQCESFIIAVCFIPCVNIAVVAVSESTLDSLLFLVSHMHYYWNLFYNDLLCIFICSDLCYSEWVKVDFQYYCFLNAEVSFVC